MMACLLKAGGFAAEFGEEPFDSEKLQMVREALNRIIEKHEPYPAFVVNIGYKILMANSGFITMVKHFLSESAISKYDNVYRIVFARDGLRQYIKNWETVEHFMLARLWDEAISTQNEDLIELYEEMSQLRSNTAPVDFNIDSSTPTLSLTLEKGPLTASFFSTIATLGTPLDLTTQELRIEMLFPTDNDTKALFYQ